MLDRIALEETAGGCGERVAADEVKADTVAQERPVPVLLGRACEHGDNEGSRLDDAKQARVAVVAARIVCLAELREGDGAESDVKGGRWKCPVREDRALRASTPAEQ